MTCTNVPSINILCKSSSTRSSHLSFWKEFWDDKDENTCKDRCELISFRRIARRYREKCSLPVHEVLMETFHRQFTSVSDNRKQCQNLHSLCWTIQKQHRKARLSTTVSILIALKFNLCEFFFFLNPYDINLITNKRIILSSFWLLSIYVGYWAL